TLSGTTEAFIGAKYDANTVTGGSSGKAAHISVDSGVHVNATTTNAEANAHATAGSGGVLASGAGFEVHATNSLTTRAFIGDGTHIARAGALDVIATSATQPLTNALAASGRALHGQ